ncbi:thiol reductant ABC exporter subunit CydC [Pseudoxanthomonas broegbernensis]|uniref:Thiol reductant ABC exporter subunit CydC n=1 Tax=Pseudoxanthomonas broegbernensis TaxID=83619 RepID=A0A7V8K7V8_9GAMM|nr:thiol reductant ABC exporter subunit CydC [Pseudoxanthomonas broegbernensis]KAF1687603.1 thiol reductant ABC exporter subunit CydC [Pseudoxanthomonas broegbernensis]MBB6064625.1 ATP-binding cassette subfamily C protein CydC [Pseudoxanthomonas broegbernensis]
MKPVRSEGLAAVFAVHRGRMLAAAAALLATMLAGTALLGLAGGFITAAALAAGTAAGFNFFSPSAGVRALALARILSRYAEKLAGHDATLRIARDLRAWFFRRALPLAPARLGALRTGELMGRLMDDIGQVDGLFVRALGPLAAMLGIGLLGIAWAAWVDPWAAPILAVAALAMGAGVPALVARRGQVLEHRHAALQAALRTCVHEGIEGAADLAAMGATRRWAGRVDDAAGALADSGCRRRRRLSAGDLLHALCGMSALLAMTVLATSAAHAGRIAPAHAAALVFVTLALLDVWAGAGLAWQALQGGRASARRLRAVVDAAATVVDPPLPQAVPATGALCLQGVVFAHPGGRRVLDGIDLRIEPGQRVAIGGDSGGGKSTLTALALRVHDPAAGAVRWDGVDLRRFAQAEWHARVAWLPQEATVFAGSVRQNLRMGDPEAGEAAMWRVLAALDLEARVRASGGLDSEVGEGGALLSAGQARRLALARALLRPAPLLVLDEPTEGLDEDAAAALLLDLERALGGRSLLLVSHGALPASLPWRRLRLQDGRLHPVTAPGMRPPG